MEKFTNIDEHIALFPSDVQEKLQLLRKTILESAPNATEKIAYGIPTFFLKKNLVHFAGYKNHIGFYPGASGIANFQEEISKYKNSKGAVQFPIDKPLPIALIKKIVKFRVMENSK
jgi:uncharacterized protein YdhG (YjbR/CyaY superfamily)